MKCKNLNKNSKTKGKEIYDDDDEEKRGGKGRRNKRNKAMNGFYEERVQK